MPNSTTKNLDPAITNIQDGTFLVEGKVTFANVMQLYQAALPAIKSHSQCTINFANTQSRCSALVALLLAWCRYAKNLQHRLQFKALPNHIQDIIRVSGLSDQLPII